MAGDFSRVLFKGFVLHERATDTRSSRRHGRLLPVQGREGAGPLDGIGPMPPVDAGDAALKASRRPDGRVVAQLGVSMFRDLLAKQMGTLLEGQRLALEAATNSQRLSGRSRKRMPKPSKVYRERARATPVLGNEPFTTGAWRLRVLLAAESHAGGGRGRTKGLVSEQGQLGLQIHRNGFFHMARTGLRGGFQIVGNGLEGFSMGGRDPHLALDTRQSGVLADGTLEDCKKLPSNRLEP